MCALGRSAIGNPRVSLLAQSEPRYHPAPTTLVQTSSTMTMATAHSYAGIVSERVEAERVRLAGRWLDGLRPIWVPQ